MARARLRRFFRHGFLPQLMAFEASVRLGSVTRAAEELSLAQPTVSCMLRKLSETLGAPVTVMRERRMEASELGHEVLLLCHDMFRAMERFEERERTRSGGGGGISGTGYDHPLEETNHTTPPWLSSSPSRSPSRWKQRASQCPRAKRRLNGTDGAL
ncbi:MAG: LysR family transcriptional regulator [Usitatibacter sp.]